MLFEGWEIQFSDAWENHPFNAANNVNGVEGDLDGNGQGFEFNTMDSSAMGRRVLDLQQAYVRKVIDTVNDLDNVLYEICNEAHPASTEWQYHLIRFVKEYESRKAKQHPVGMTFQYKGGTNSTLYDEPGGLDLAESRAMKESYRRSVLGLLDEGGGERYGPPVGPHGRRQSLGVEELHARTERAVHGGIAAVADVAGFGEGGDGAGAALRRPDESGGDEAGGEAERDEVLPGRTWEGVSGFPRTRASSHWT